MKIRKATKKDLESLVELNISLAKYERKICKHLVDPEKVRKEYAKEYENRFKQKKSIFFVAEENEKIVGYILGEVQRPYHPHIFKNRGYIVDAFVLKKYRGKGIGEKLTERLIEWFKSKGIKWIKVSAYTNNEIRIKFWKKMGFKDYVIDMTKIEE